MEFDKLSQDLSNLKIVRKTKYVNVSREITLMKKRINFFQQKTNDELVQKDLKVLMKTIKNLKTYEIVNESKSMKIKKSIK
jgi:hypothetical protein